MCIICITVLSIGEYNSREQSASYKNEHFIRVHTWNSMRNIYSNFKLTVNAIRPNFEDSRKILAGLVSEF